MGLFSFGAQYYPYSLASHALQLLLPSVAQGLLPVVWLLPFRAGFPPACMSCPLLGALCFQKHKSERKAKKYEASLEDVGKLSKTN